MGEEAGRGPAFKPEDAFPVTGVAIVASEWSNADGPRLEDCDGCAKAVRAANTAYIALATSVSRMKRLVRRGSRRRAPFIFIPSLLDKRTVQSSLAYMRAPYELRY